MFKNKEESLLFTYISDVYMLVRKNGMIMDIHVLLVEP